MGFLDRDEREEIEQLRRIADALEFIGRLLSIYLPSTSTNATGVNGMSLPVSPVATGTSFTGTYTAVDANGNTLAGPIAFTSSDTTSLTVTGDGSTTGVSVVTCDVIGVAGATPILTATFTNADGTTTSVGTNNPFTVTIAAAAVDDAVAVDGV
jgi:hypothetical protein